MENEVKEDATWSRRSFFQMALAGLTVVPFIIKSAKAQASDACPAVAPKGKAVAVAGEGMAKGLEYVVDAKTSKNAKYKAGQTCGTCKFYNAAKAESGHAPCTMMGMKFVTHCGWCKSFSAKA